MRMIMLEEKVILIVKESLENPDLAVALDSNLEEDLEVDSFTAVMILRAVEDEFGLSLSDDFLPRIRTVRDIVEELKRLGVSLEARP
jgi:acyl carrier protein